MKESSVNATLRRIIFLEVGKASLVIVGLMLLMTIGLAIAGQFRVDTSGTYGIYESGLAPEAYFNPFWKLLADTELVALMILPLPLLMLRRRVRVAVVPWALVAFFTVIGATSRLYYPPLYDRFDPNLDSRLWLLLRANIFIGLSVFVSYFAYLGYKKRREIWRRHKDYFTKKEYTCGQHSFCVECGFVVL